MPDLLLTTLFSIFYLPNGNVFTGFVGKATNVVKVKIAMENVKELT